MDINLTPVIPQYELPQPQVDSNSAFEEARGHAFVETEASDIERSLMKALRTIETSFDNKIFKDALAELAEVSRKSDPGERDAHFRAVFNFAQAKNREDCKADVVFRLANPDPIQEPTQHPAVTPAPVAIPQTPKQLNWSRILTIAGVAGGAVAVLAVSLSPNFRNQVINFLTGPLVLQSTYKKNSMNCTEIMTVPFVTIQHAANFALLGYLAHKRGHGGIQNRCSCLTSKVFIGLFGLSAVVAVITGSVPPFVWRSETEHCRG